MICGLGKNPSHVTDDLEAWSVLRKRRAIDFYRCFILLIPLTSDIWTVAIRVDCTICMIPI